MAKSPKESNTGLVVTLVFFILSTLGLGVSTYMGFAEQKKNLDAAKDAETKKKDSDDRKRLYAAEAQLLYKYITNKDLPIEAGDKMEIPGDRQVIRDKAGWASKGVPGLEEALAEIENTQGVNAAGIPEKILRGDGTVTTPFMKVAENSLTMKRLYETGLQKQRADHDKALADLRAENESNKKLMDDKVAKAEAAQKKWQDDFMSFRKVVSDLQATEKGAADGARKDMLAKLDNIAAEAQKEAEAKKDTEIANLRKALADQRRDNDRLKKNLTSATLMTPTGWKVVKIEKDPRLVYINLGADADVRPGDYFFVHGNQDNGLPEPKSKGKVEVVRVVDGKLALAQVTQLDDAGGNPIRQDDHLNSPVWSPNMRKSIAQRKHIVLRGRMYLKGGDVDNTLELVKRLEDMGVIVDAFVDFNDKNEPLKIGANSTGLSEKTSLVVEGLDPFQGKIKADDKVSEAMYQLDNQARDFNIPRIKLQGFLESLGWER